MEDILRMVDFHYAMALVIQLLAMFPQKSRLVLAYPGVVPWDALLRVWRRDATGFYRLEAPCAHYGGNVPFHKNTKIERTNACIEAPFMSRTACRGCDVVGCDGTGEVGRISVDLLTLPSLLSILSLSLPILSMFS